MHVSCRHPRPSPTPSGVQVFQRPGVNNLAVQDPLKYSLCRLFVCNLLGHVLPWCHIPGPKMGWEHGVDKMCTSLPPLQPASKDTMPITLFASAVNVIWGQMQ
jgi:hypothetical protein